jgi:hypothetical protein
MKRLFFLDARITIVAAVDRFPADPVAGVVSWSKHEQSCFPLEKKSGCATVGP